MKYRLGNNAIRIIIILIIVAVPCGISFYKARNNKILNKEVFTEFNSSVKDLYESEDSGFSDQRALMDHIEQWADSNSLDYIEDKSGNIIFDRKAAERKSNVTPTLVAVSMNYETAGDNSEILAAAASIAYSDIESGRRTVVFFNDEQGLGKGFKGIRKSYLSSKSKVIYLDKGSSNYISTASFQERFSEVSVPAVRENNPCDTAVRVTITGIESGVISTGINKQPSPVYALSALLTRLKSKSVECRLADVSIVSNGNMYPVSLKATIALNSYNMSSFTGYIDKRIKSWEKTYGENNKNLEYTYEIIEDEDSLPETVYDAETTDRLTGVLYTIKNGAYRYSNGDPLPEGKEIGDAYGINCQTGLYSEDDLIRLTMITQGVSDSYTDRITNDNKAAAELYGCSFDITETVPAFENTRDSLSRTFSKTYKKLIDPSSANAILSFEKDNFFTPCSYLAAKNGKADIIHIRSKASNTAQITNCILCYIKAKGNTSIFK